MNIIKLIFVELKLICTRGYKGWVFLLGMRAGLYTTPYQLTQKAMRGRSENWWYKINEQLCKWKYHRETMLAILLDIEQKQKVAELYNNSAS